MRRARSRVSLGTALLGLANVPGVAAAMQAAIPSPVVAAFDETCRQGFPDLAAVRRAAVAAGWSDSQVRAVGGTAAFQNASVPQVLRKGALTLFLATPNAIGMRHSCQVSGPADPSLDIAGLASAASIALGLGTPQFSRAGGAELAQWRPDASTLVQASVNRRPRSASLQVRIER